MKNDRFRYRFQVKRVYRRFRGSPLDGAVTAAVPANGGEVRVESVAEFLDEGGTAWFEFEDDTKKEKFHYRGRNERRDVVTGVTRNPDQRKSHADGTFVSVGKRETRQRWADGYLEDEDRITSGIRIPNHLAHYFELGERRIEDMESCWVGGDEDGLWVTDVDYGLPLQAVFSWGAPRDAEVLWDSPYRLNADAAIQEVAVQLSDAVTGSAVKLRLNIWRGSTDRGMFGAEVTIPVGQFAAELGGADLMRRADTQGGVTDGKKGDYVYVEFLTASSLAGTLNLEMKRKV